MYEDLAGAILNDPSFPDNPAKSPNRRYLRIEARYCGQYRLELFDDLWTEYVNECKPAQPTEWRDRKEHYRAEERHRIVDLLTEFVEENRTGCCDGFCDKILDELEKLGNE